jgi:hypothetical protein
VRRLIEPKRDVPGINPCIVASTIAASSVEKLQLWRGRRSPVQSHDHAPDRSCRKLHFCIGCPFRVYLLHQTEVAR